MQVSVENSSELGRRLIIGVPIQRVQEEEQTKIDQLSKSARLDGFRAGKVPKRLVSQKYGKQVRQEVIAKLLETTLGDALMQEKLKPASRPNVEEINDNQGEDLRYVVSFEVFPEITLADLSQITIKKPTVEISSDDVAAYIVRLQDQLATWSVVEREGKDGDQLNIDFVGLKDGVPFENGSAEKIDLVLGSNQFIPGFEEGLLGAKAGDSKTLDLVFPDSYGAKELAGQAVQFNVDVREVKEKQPAAIDAEFAKKIGAESEDQAHIETAVKQRMEALVAEISDEQVREQALEQLHTLNDIHVPNTMLEQEKNNIREEVKRRHQGQELDASHDEQIESDAKQRVALGLLLNEVVRLNNIKLDESRVKEKIRAMAVRFGNAELIEKMYYESKELLQNVQNMVLTDQATDLVVEKATLEEQATTFDELVGQSS